MKTSPKPARKNPDKKAHNKASSRAKSGQARKGEARTGQARARKNLSGTSRKSGSGQAHTGKDSAGNVKDTGIRLNRYIAGTGICSRREADELIAAGQVSVNGKTVTELGTRVHPSDSVRYRGKLVKGERKVYVLLNKPKDCVTTVKDTHGRKTVMDIVSGCCTERIYPVGRLDRNTTGVLLLTNDGELTDGLTHPSFNKKKIYHIHLDRNLGEEDMQKIGRGLELDDGFIRPDRVEYADPDDSRQVGMEIHSGRNRIVRRMFEHLDYRILRLDRVYFAGLTKKGLPRGHWRHLNQKEVNMLKMSVPHKKSGKRSGKS